MKKVFLCAYDKVNFGDDLFIRTIVNRYPDVRFYMISDKKNRYIFKENNNLKIIDRNSTWIKLLRKIRASFPARFEHIIKKKCVAVVYIGGSVFMEYPTWKNMVNWWNYQVSQYPFYVVGANFGPYQSEDYKEEMNNVFEKMEDICFRDKYSAKLFENNNKVRSAADILFSYPVLKEYDKKRQICFSLINCEKKENGKFKNYEKAYRKFCRNLAINFIKQGYKICFVSFCEEEGDSEVCAYFCDELTQRFDGICEHVIYNGINTEEIIKTIAASEWVVATRFHAIVMGLITDCKVLPIIYSDKSENMLEDIGFQNKCFKIEELSDDIYVEENVFNDEDYVYVDVKSLKRDSQQHFKELDLILK